MGSKNTSKKNKEIAAKDVSVSWTSHAWDDYTEWAEGDLEILGKINDLINDIQRNYFTGLGKPEPLKGNLAGYWSRRITGKHRLVYSVQNDVIIVVMCKFHYGDK